MPSYQMRFYRASDREPVVEFLDEEVEPPHKAKAYHLLAYLQSVGTNRNKYVDKLQGDIWELRVDFAGVCVRILFCFGESATFYILHAFKKKTNKVPQREIEVAQHRANLMKKGGGGPNAGR